MLLTVTIDGRQLGQPQYLRYANGELLLPAATLKALRIQPSPAWRPPVPLHQLAGEFFTLDYHKLTLSVIVPPRLLKKSLLELQRQSVALGVVSPGEGGQPVASISGSHSLSAIVSYDVAGGYDSSSGNWNSGIYQTAIGDDRTTCRTAFLDQAYQPGLLRLDSLCSYDWPDQMVSLSVGDAIGGGNVVAQPVRYGGIRIGTNFALQPNVITLPVSRISGTARVPSTLEVWVDQMLALRSEIPAGPFEVQNIPLHTGAGELKATIISPTGARRVITSPFYADSSLLAAGLADWSINLGKLRTGFATINDHYADPFAAADIRYGLTSGFTGMLGFQAARDFKFASAGAAMRIGSWAVVDLAAGYSANRHGGSGSAVRGRFARQGPHFNISYQWQRNSRGYQELAWPVPGTAPETTRQLSLGMPLPGGMSFRVSGYDRRHFDGTSLQFTSASLSINLGDWGNLLLSGFHLTQDNSPWAYAAQLTVPFGERSNISAWTQTDGGVQRQRVGLQMSPPAGPGFGYRLALGRNGTRQTGSLDLELQGDVAELDLGANQYGDTRAASARLAGSILLSGDGLALSRRKAGSYAVVHVGVPDVPVYHDGQLVGSSDSDGTAVVAGLRPYDDNTIAIQPGDVPINVQPRALKAVLTPGRREIMSAAFNFEPVHYVTGQLQVVSGKFVPRGSVLQISGTAAKTVVGEDGRFFVTSPAGDNLAIQASWSGHVCRAVAKLNPKAGGTVTELGVLNCKVSSQ
ncbi:MAG TPA: fimbria/pilus outer membrane usher protein [Gammaproteobacteria bacterium]|nr:fimbria/pilus outer membrane usher protein [Gammaproteobacteria bacterium]